jgi:hypothetical protein
MKGKYEWTKESQRNTKEEESEEEEDSGVRRSRRS